MERVKQWPLWLKGVAILGSIASFVVLAAASGVIGNRADAFVVWAFPLLLAAVTVPVWGLLLFILLGWSLGMAAYSFLHRKEPFAAVDSDPKHLSSPAAEPTPREKAEAELAEVLQVLAQGNAESLPRILPRLRFIFDRLGRGEDSAWCQAELHGYTQDDTPQYRYADVTIDWRSTGGVVTMDRMTGSVVGKPPERVVSLPLADPVEDLVRLSRTGKRTATGNIQPGLMEAWREVAEISPQAVQGVLRRILDEGYRRAIAANALGAPDLR